MIVREYYSSPGVVDIEKCKAEASRYFSESGARSIMHSHAFSEACDEDCVIYPE